MKDAKTRGLSHATLMGIKKTMGVQHPKVAEARYCGKTTRRGK
jgi:hypothetical protein